MKGYHFSQNEEVAHVGNITQCMRVHMIKWKTVHAATSEVKDGKSVKATKKYLDCIETIWWDDGGVFHKEKFHSGQLVPWAIAGKGQAAVDSFSDQIASQTIYFNINKER